MPHHAGARLAVREDAAYTFAEERSCRQVAAEIPQVAAADLRDAGPVRCALVPRPDHSNALAAAPPAPAGSPVHRNANPRYLVRQRWQQLLAWKRDNLRPGPQS